MITCVTVLPYGFDDDFFRGRTNFISNKFSEEQKKEFEGYFHLLNAYTRDTLYTYGADAVAKTKSFREFVSLVSTEFSKESRDQIKQAIYSHLQQMASAKEGASP